MLLLVSFTACKSTSKVKSSTSKLKTEAEIMAIKTPLEQYCALTEGTFIVQQEESPGHPKDLYIYNDVTIFKEDWGKHWFYSEGAMVTLLDEPFDQAVLEVIKYSRDTMYVNTYRIKDAERFVLGWYDTDKLKSLTKDDLIPADEGCAMITVQKAPGVYETADKGLCKVIDGANDNSYTHTTTLLNYEGFCGTSVWYNDQKEISQAADERCAMFKRDLTGKYQKELAAKHKQHK